MRPSLDLAIQHAGVLGVEVGKTSEPTVLHALLIGEVDQAFWMEEVGRLGIRQPGMTVPDVIQDDIEDDLETAFMSGSNQLVELLRCTEMPVDLRGIQRPVPVIPALRLLRERREPDRGHAEALDVIELVDHPLQIAAL